MGFRTLATILLFAVVLAMPSDADEANDAVRIRYRWEAGTAYRYESTYYADGNEVERRETIIEVLSVSEGRWTLAIQDAKAMPRFDLVLFLSVDEHGIADPDSLKVGGEGKYPTPGEASFSYALYVSSLPEKYHQGLWELPSSPMGKGISVDFHGRKFIFRGYLEKRGEVAELEVTKDPLTSKGQEKEIRLFDMSKGIMVQSRHIQGKNVSWVMKLNGSSALGEKRVALRKAQLEKALPADEFRLKTLLPLLASPKRGVKRTPFLELGKMRDENALMKAYGELMKTADGDEYFDMLADNFISEHLRSGKKWALEALLVREMPSWGGAVSIIEDLSGLQFGDDREKWKSWFQRIEKVLPSMTASTTEELLTHSSNKDSWVRLFVLGELGQRNGVDLEPILQRAIVDQDEKVRERAAKLKKERQKQE